MAIGVKHPLLMRVCLHAFHVTDVQQVQCSGIAPNSTVVNVLYIKCDVPFVGCIECIRECGSTLYVGMTRTAARAAYRLIQK